MNDGGVLDPLYVECKFELSNREGVGGDFERNVGGSVSERRVKFEGYATPELYGAVMDAVREMAAGPGKGEE